MALQEQKGSKHKASKILIKNKAQMLLKERHKFLEPNLKRNCGFSVSAFLQINTPNLSKNGILAKHLTVGLNMRKAE